MKEWLTITEAAEYLGVHRETVRNMLNDDRLQGHISGRDRRVTLIKTEDLDALKEPQAKTGE